MFIGEYVLKKVISLDKLETEERTLSLDPVFSFNLMKKVTDNGNR